MNNKKKFTDTGDKVLFIFVLLYIVACLVFGVLTLIEGIIPYTILFILFAGIGVCNSVIVWGWRE